MKHAYDNDNWCAYVVKSCSTYRSIGTLDGLNHTDEAGELIHYIPEITNSDMNHNAFNNRNNLITGQVGCNEDYKMMQQLNKKEGWNLKIINGCGDIEYSKLNYYVEVKW